MNNPLRPVFGQKCVCKQANDVIAFHEFTRCRKEKTPIKVTVPGDTHIRLFGSDDCGSGLAILEQ